MSEEFHALSEQYLANTDLTHRKLLGQYFTPKSVREKLLSMLPRFERPKILDPANGTGEFLKSAGEYFDTPELHGWEIDPDLVQISRTLVPQARIEQTDSLFKDCSELYDFVIGNPPYFEFRPEDKIRHRFRDVINGRPNIFAMFIKLGLDVLKPGGYLAYVIPPSMNNGAYFSKLREFIMERANITHIAILESSAMFHDALQKVMIMVLRKGKNKGDFIFRKNGISIFTIKPEELENAFAGKATLRELGFIVKTGKIVWNQHKERLTNNPDGAIPLIWAHNITPHGIRLNNSEKKLQYIRINRYDEGPAIIVNRITGAANNVSIKAAAVQEGFRFLGENHVNVIYAPRSGSQFSLNLGRHPDSSSELMGKLVKAIAAPETVKAMRLVTGNTQISRTELENLTPLDLGG